MDAPVNISVPHNSEEECQNVGAQWCWTEPNCAAFDCSPVWGPFKPQFFTSVVCHNDSDFTHYSKSANLTFEGPSLDETTSMPPWKQRKLNATTTVPPGSDSPTANASSPKKVNA